MGVPTVEEQVYAGQVAEEERRCGELRLTGQRVSAREVSPWKRIGPRAICQDPGLLRHVTEYDYKLSNPVFQEYCRARGTLHVAGVPDSPYWQFFEDYSKTREAYLADPYFDCAAPFEGKRYRYTSGEREAQWSIVCSGRGVLQDCWQLLRAQTEEQRKAHVRKRRKALWSLSSRVRRR